MFGHMKAHPILAIGTSSIESAISALLVITENAQPVRWVEFPASVLLCVSVQGDPESGAFYVFERKTGTWFWMIHEYDILSLVERPGLLNATPGWILEPGKPAEMAAPAN